MKKILICLLSFALLNTNCNSQPKVKTVVNDANAVKRSVVSFNALEVGQAIQVYLSQGDEDAVAVSCSEADKTDNIKTEVKNGTLKIYLEQSFWDNFGNNNFKIKAYVSVKSLTSIKASGASNVKINETLNCNDLVIKLSGASVLKGTIKASNLKASISGASNINITGTSEDCTLDCTGASSFKGFDFTTTKCKIDASGASSVNITTTQEIKADASGASSIKYGGSPTNVVVESSGASSIKKKD